MVYKKFHHLRENAQLRQQFAEVNFQLGDFIIPFFVIEGVGLKIPVKGFTNVFHYSLDQLMIELKGLTDKGFNQIMLFGVVNESQKSNNASYAFSQESIVAKAIQKIKSELPIIKVFVDVCMCAYTVTGHCGIFENGKINNELSIEILSSIATNYACAGADFVCPSAMMDGQVWAIRNALNQAKLHNTKILAYSAKYASNFYGPFREAANSAPAFGDRKSYQLDYRTINQGLDEVAADVEEGADWIMVKPAHTYLDMITRVKSRFNDIPLVAYQTSGEYMMLKLLVQNQLADENELFHESLVAIKRSGADYIITYAFNEINSIVNS